MVTIGTEIRIEILDAKCIQLFYIVETLDAKYNFIFRQLSQNCQRGRMKWRHGFILGTEIGQMLKLFSYLGSSELYSLCTIELPIVLTNMVAMITQQQLHNQILTYVYMPHRVVLMQSRLYSIQGHLLLGYVVHYYSLEGAQTHLHEWLLWRFFSTAGVCSWNLRKSRRRTQLELLGTC